MMTRIVRGTAFAILSCCVSFISFLSIAIFIIKPWFPWFMDEGVAIEVFAFVLAGVMGFRYGYRSRPHDAKLLASGGIYNESAEIIFFYFTLFVVPTGFLFWVCINAMKHDHEGIGAAWAIVTWPPIVNSCIMAVSLAATPWVKRYSAGWASAYHVRNSISFPIISVLIAWLGAAIRG